MASKKNIIKILDHEMELVFEESNFDHFGKSDTLNGLIVINNKMTKSVKDSTLLHEIIHFIIDVNSIVLSEQTIDNLAVGIMSFIKNNKLLVRNLIE